MDKLIYKDSDGEMNGWMDKKNKWMNELMNEWLQMDVLTFLTP